MTLEAPAKKAMIRNLKTEWRDQVTGRKRQKIYRALDVGTTAAGVQPWFWHWQAIWQLVRAWQAAWGLPSTLIAMPTPKVDEQSAMKQWFKRKCSWVLPRKHRALSTSRHLDAPDARPTTATANVQVPSTNVSPPLPVSPAQPPTVPRPTGSIGKHISQPSPVSIAIKPVHRDRS